jgi:hypothetical protein
MKTKIILESNLDLTLEDALMLEDAYEFPILNRDVCLNSYQIKKVNLENGWQYITIDGIFDESDKNNFIEQLKEFEIS